MTFSGPYEAPRLRLISTRLAPSAELVSRSLKQRQTEYAEERQAKVVHAFRSARCGIDKELPLMLMAQDPTGVVIAAPDVIAELVREKVRRGVSGPAQMRTRGPFTDQLDVTINKDSR